jgi:hypothetical protein
MTARAAETRSILLPESEIYAILFGNVDWRIAGRAAGNEDFSPASTTQGANSKAEANFLFQSGVTH